MLKYGDREVSVQQQYDKVPPRPSDDIHDSVVFIVLVLQTRAHHLVRVRGRHGKDFGQRRHRNIFQCHLSTEMSERECSGKREKRKKGREYWNCK